MLVPERLRLAAVVPDGRPVHRERLRGRAPPGPVLPDDLPDLGLQRERDLPLARDDLPLPRGQVDGARTRRPRTRPDHITGTGRGDGDGPPQPLEQPQRRDAVVPVVVRDALEELVGLRVPAGVAQVRVLGVRDDGRGGVLHVAGAQVVAHVQRLELLDGP
ncbi:hypothetical protein BJF88_12270 [Cellulosimicrobium sp. CUA-896]|nr:hypothetical protein BJF88_12270 [Cellulosimicrobium sp. CUA-896]